MNKKKIHKPDSIPIPEYQMESLARVLLPIMREYLLSEQGQKDYAEWQQLQLNKQFNNDKNLCISTCNQKDNLDKKGWAFTYVKTKGR